MFYHIQICMEGCDVSHRLTHAQERDAQTMARFLPIMQKHEIKKVDILSNNVFALIMGRFSR